MFVSARARLRALCMSTPMRVCQSVCDCGLACVCACQLTCLCARACVSVYKAARMTVLCACVRGWLRAACRYSMELADMVALLLQPSAEHRPTIHEVWEMESVQVCVCVCPPPTAPPTTTPHWRLPLFYRPTASAAGYSADRAAPHPPPPAHTHFVLQLHIQRWEALKAAKRSGVLVEGGVVSPLGTPLPSAATTPRFGGAAPEREASKGWRPPLPHELYVALRAQRAPPSSVLVVQTRVPRQLLVPVAPPVAFPGRVLLDPLLCVACGCRVLRPTRLRPLQRCLRGGVCRGPEGRLPQRRRRRQRGGQEAAARPPARAACAAGQGAGLGRIGGGGAQAFPHPACSGSRACPWAAAGGWGWMSWRAALLTHVCTRTRPGDRAFTRHVFCLQTPLQVRVAMRCSTLCPGGVLVPRDTRRAPGAGCQWEFVRGAGSRLG
jgi:hypothetical protein